MPKILAFGIALVAILVCCRAPEGGGAGASSSSIGVELGASSSSSSISSSGAGGAASAPWCAPPPQRFGATPGDALPVASPAPATAGTIVSASANPDDGAQNVHLANQTPSLVSWQFAAPSTARPLAPAWSQATTVAQYDAMLANGFTCVATTGGTTADAGAGPDAAGPDAGGLDGSVTWLCYAGTTYQGQLSITDTDATNPAYVGDSHLQLAIVPAGNGGIGVLPANPSATYARAPTGTPVVIVTGIP